MRIEDFQLAWRWTQDSHARLPKDVLATVVPIDTAMAGALYERGENAFRDQSAVDVGSCKSADAVKARQWLRALPVPSDSTVTIVWNRELGVNLPWGVFTEYWDDFCYPTSDDAFIVLPVRQGIISYEHYEEFRHRADVA